MAGLRDWAYSVAVTVVFGTLAETVMPNNTYKKYIHLILGLLLLLTLTKPAVNLIAMGGVGEYVGEYAAAFNSAAAASEEAADEIEDRQKSDIIQIYKSTLESSIASGIESACGVAPESVRVDIADTDVSTVYGRIERVVITLPKVASAQNQDIIETAANITGLRPGKIILEEA